MAGGRAGGQGSEGVDAPAEGGSGGPEWVSSFLRTQPGKTYRLDATDDAREDAARAAAAAAARTLTDRVLRAAKAPARDEAPTSVPPS